MANENLVYSSAVLCLSPTTEIARNRTIDTIIMQVIVSQGLDTSFTVEEVYHALQQEFPIRYEEVRNSILRGLKNKYSEVVTGDDKYIDSAKLRLSSKLTSLINSEGEKIRGFLKEAAQELFGDIYTDVDPEIVENCLLDCLSRLMARYGYAYAGQVAGMLEASEFVPLEALKEVCQSAIDEHKIEVVNVDRLVEAIGVLFDRRDPCLNNLAFSICQRYYSSRLMGLDLPIDFLSEQIYKNSTIYFDTNFVCKVAFSGSGIYKEFKEVLKFGPKLGINFAVYFLTVAELLQRVGNYRDLLKEAEDTVPAELFDEVVDDIFQSGTTSTAGAERNFSIDSRSARRLQEMGVNIVGPRNVSLLEDGEELDQIKSELHEFDIKHRKTMNRKDDNALYHDAQLCHIVTETRKETRRSTASWFLTDDNSVIEHGIHKKGDGEPPYSIKLMTLLTTISPFVESQALKLEFEDLFMNLVSKDLLPKEQLFGVDDLKMFVGFDMVAKEMPPEFVRKGVAYIKKEILKGGGLTEENKPNVLYEFTKYLSAPEKNFMELQRRYEGKIQARDNTIEDKDQEIDSLKSESEKQKEKNTGNIVMLASIFVSVILWIGYGAYLDSLVKVAERPLFLTIAVQLIVISVGFGILYRKRALITGIVGGLLVIASIIAGLA